MNLGEITKVPGRNCTWAKSPSFVTASWLSFVYTLYASSTSFGYALQVARKFQASCKTASRYTVICKLVRTIPNLKWPKFMYASLCKYLTQTLLFSAVPLSFYSFRRHTIRNCSFYQHNCTSYYYLIRFNERRQMGSIWAVFKQLKLQPSFYGLNVFLQRFLDRFTLPYLVWKYFSNPRLLQRFLTSKFSPI